jgi:predicted MPP superfamily phosphohydrolase
MKWNRLLAGAVAAAVLVLGFQAVYLEPSSLTVQEHELSLPRWSAELAGLRVAVLTDLHVGAPYMGISKLEEIVDRVNGLKPDLILLPGDFVEAVLGGRFVAPEQTAAVLARLSAPLGVWACLGNHDWSLGARRVAAAFEKEKIPVLEDRAVRIQRGDAHFWLVGISDFRRGPHDVRKAFAQAGDGAPVLAFTHNPDVFPAIPYPFSLLIAGHTHGGQVRLPLLGRPVTFSKYGQRYAFGHVVEGERHLFVSPGLGTSILPVRFGVPPEVTVLELHPET